MGYDLGLSGPEVLEEVPRTEQDRGTKSDEIEHKKEEVLVVSKGA